MKNLSLNTSAYISLTSLSLILMVYVMNYAESKSCYGIWTGHITCSK